LVYELVTVMLASAIIAHSRKTFLWVVICLWFIPAVNFAQNSEELLGHLQFITCPNMSINSLYCCNRMLLCCCYLLNGWDVQN